MRVASFLILLLSVGSSAASDQLRVTDYISDNMVIQRHAQIVVRGVAPIGSVVSVSLPPYSKSCRTDKHGEWEVTLPPMEKGNALTLRVSTGDESATFSNIAIGDVWVASGQSNMEHPICGWPFLPHSSIYRAEEETANASISDIRLLTIPKFVASRSNTKKHHPDWVVAAPSTVQSFSSTAWFFASYLHKELSVPIGIIHCSWGGTRIESWMSPEALARCGVRIPIKQTSLPSYEQQVENRATSERRRMMISYPTDQQKNIALSFKQVNGWHSIDSIPSPNGEGCVAWYRKRIVLSEQIAKEPLLLSLGYLNRQSFVYFNNEQVGDYLYPEPAMGILPRRMLRPGENELVIRIATPFGTAHATGALSQCYLSSLDGSLIQLIGDDWEINRTIDSIPPPINTFESTPSGLYYGMTSSLFHTAIKGIIWYQGESNANNPTLYTTLFGEMIRDYRKQWKSPNLPFVYAQVCGYKPAHTIDTKGGRVALREAQRTGETNVAEVITIDIGDPYDVHPRNKREVGRRMALSALRMVYNKNVIASAPQAVKAVRKGGKIVVSFTDRKKTLSVPPNTALMGFELYAQNGTFVPKAKVNIYSEVEITIPPGINAEEVAYGWSDSPRCNLYGENQLPVAPFKLRIE